MKYYPALEANAKTCASFQRLTRIMGQSKMDAMLHFGGFALSGNDKWSFLKNTDYWLQRAKNVGYPAYGEAYESHYFLEIGYDGWQFYQFNTKY